MANLFKLIALKRPPLIKPEKSLSRAQSESIIRNCRYFIPKPSHLNPNAKTILKEMKHDPVVNSKKAAKRYQSVELLKDPFIDFCGLGKLEKIREILETKISPENRPVLVNINDGHATPIIAAIRAGHIDIVRYLVSQGASVSLPVASYHTPLRTAIARNQNEIAHFLLQQGAGKFIRQYGSEISVFELAAQKKMSGLFDSLTNPVNGAESDT